MTTGSPELDELARELDAEIATMSPERKAEFLAELEKWGKSNRQFMERARAEVKAGEDPLLHPRGDS